MRFDKGKKEIQVNFALIRRYGGTFSLRAKSRLRRLRSDTRLRAQPRRGRLTAERLLPREKLSAAPSAD